MKQVLLIFLYLLFLVESISSCSRSDSAFISPSEEKSLPFGVNLAGAEFAERIIPGTLETHYVYPTTAELDYFKQKRLKLIRFPFRWERIQRSLNGELNKDELQRMKAVVSEAQKRGMYVLLDMHNYARRITADGEFIIGSKQVSITNISDAWVKIATEFKDFSNIWGYGLMNEPYRITHSPFWVDIAQDIIYNIRTVDTTTPIFIGGNSWSSSQLWVEESDTLKHLTDPNNNLVYEAHIYFDKDCSGTYKNSYDEEGCTPMRGAERIYPFLRWLKENNKKGFVGEYGIPSNDSRWLTTLDNLLGIMSEYGVNGTYWAAGSLWKDYPLSVEPSSTNKDKPQMRVLSKYPATSKKQEKILLSRNKNVKVSASSYTYPPEAPEKINDGNYATRWNSNEKGDKWIAYDFGQNHSINRIVLQWERWDITKSFTIQTSEDGKNWENKFIEKNNTEPLRILNLNSKNTRHIRLYVNGEDDYIVRLCEFEVWTNK